MTTPLASLASESTGLVFTSQCNLLRKVISVWESGEQFNIQGILISFYMKYSICLCHLVLDKQIHLIDTNGGDNCRSGLK